MATLEDFLEEAVQAKEPLARRGLGEHREQ